MAARRRVLIVVEDVALSDLLAEARVDAGHVAGSVADAGAARAALDAAPFDAAVVDLDTRARDGVSLVVELRVARPGLTLIALVPCGGLGASAPAPPYHVALEKPARLAAVLAAVGVAPAAIRN